ncbi:hypothetical protein P4B35_14525 [Pontiellaceae bacterium B12227]|nr:hypothetical protein [Pontiellaceae bacterium B12227]
MKSESLNFVKYNSVQAESDWAQDGQNNLEEYVADTNPTNPVSRFRLETFSAPTLHWTAKPGRTYTVYWSDDLTKPFILLKSGLTTGSFTDTEHPEPPNFYRIEVEMP